MSRVYIFAFVAEVCATHIHFPTIDCPIKSYPEHAANRPCAPNGWGPWRSHARFACSFHTPECAFRCGPQQSYKHSLQSLTQCVSETVHLAQRAEHILCTCYACHHLLMTVWVVQATSHTCFFTWASASKLISTFRFCKKGWSFGFCSFHGHFESLQPLFVEQGRVKEMTRIPL